MAAKVEHRWLARQYIDYVYVPAGLLVAGTAIVKSDWTPYAVLLAVLLGTYNFYSFQVKKVLKQDFQEFPLEEKTVISHNVAIYRFKLPSPRSVLGLPIGQQSPSAPTSLSLMAPSRRLSVPTLPSLATISPGSSTS